MADDTVIKLTLDTNGEAVFAGLEKGAAETKAKLQELGAAFARGELGAAEFAKETRKLEGDLDQIKDVMDRLKGSGSRGGGGHGILGASYAMQDFISVLSGGGGLSRALGAVSNNVPQLLAGLGLGAGLTGIASGLFTLVAAGIPIMEKWFGGMSGEAAEKAKDKLKEIADQIESIHKQFVKLTETPTDFEKTSAETITGFLGERPNAEMAREAITRGMGRKSIEAALQQAGTREEWGKLGPTAEMTDAEIERRVRAAEFNIGRGGAPPEQAAAAAEQVRRRLENARGNAQQRRFLLEKAAKEAAAEKIIQDAQQAGPAGAQARRELLGRTKGAKGLEGLQEMSPAAIEQQEADFEAAWEESEARAEKAHAGGVGRRKQAKQEKAKNKRGQKAALKLLEEMKHEAAGAQRGRVRAAQDEARDARKAAEGTDIDERATIEAARLRATGGAADRFGRFRRLTPQQQEMRLQGMIREELARRFPAMSPMARVGTAAQIAGGAEHTVTDRVREAQAQALRQGLNANTATLGALQATIAEFQGLAARARRNEQEARNLARAAKQTMPSAASSGWQ